MRVAVYHESDPSRILRTIWCQPHEFMLQKLEPGEQMVVVHHDVRSGRYHLDHSLGFPVTRETPRDDWPEDYQPTPSQATMPVYDFLQAHGQVTQKASP